MSTTKRQPSRGYNCLRHLFDCLSISEFPCASRTVPSWLLRPIILSLSIIARRATLMLERWHQNAQRLSAPCSVCPLLIQRGLPWDTARILDALNNYPYDSQPSVLMKGPPRLFHRTAHIAQTPHCHGLPRSNMPQLNHGNRMCTFSEKSSFNTYHLTSTPCLLERRPAQNQFPI